jgi:DNA-binding transcriptional ArsR family regulator
MQSTLDAIADPRRREILRLVRDKETPAGAIAAHFPEVSRPAISQHLRVLREAGLVSERRHGTQRLYLAQPDALSELREFLAEFWDDRLARLRVEAEREHKRRKR